MNYYLAKSEPGTYSIDDLARDGETAWDGVHNFQAIAFIKSMNPGDLVYIYHSQTDKAIVGLAEVTGMPFENTADPRPSWAVKLKFVKKYTETVTLAKVKSEPSLKSFMLVTHSRLSVMPVPADAVTWIDSQVH